MRSTVPLFGFLLVVGCVAFVAVHGAPPPSDWGIIGLVVLGAFFGFAAGYGVAITERPPSGGASRPTPSP